MSAAVFHNGRMAYRYGVLEPIPKPGRVLVGVRSCGIRGIDLSGISQLTVLTCWAR